MSAQYTPTRQSHGYSDAHLPTLEDGAAREHHEDAALVTEISVRLLEWRAITSRTTVSRWVNTLGALYRADPNAMWLYLAYQTGDAAEIGRSFEDRATAEGRTRQAAQQATERTMQAIASVVPTLAVAIRQAYEANSPEAHAERYRQAS